ncbi:MAG: hypothetical protein M1334_03315 [Patescibacteria group bacterium]|nr:hypothetical protein [Patescibacteria group bacterium]
MADQSSHIQNVEHPNLEADIGRLSSEIKKHYERPEAVNLSDREIIKKSLQSAYSQPVQPKAAPAGKQVLETESILPDYAKSAPEEIKMKIEKLVEMTFREGLGKATEEAKKQDPFILDAFHDSLVEKLYPILKQRGIIK